MLGVFKKIKKRLKNEGSEDVGDLTLDIGDLTLKEMLFELRDAYRLSNYMKNKEKAKRIENDIRKYLRRYRTKEHEHLFDEYFVLLHFPPFAILATDEEMDEYYDKLIKLEKKIIKRRL